MEVEVVAQSPALTPDTVSILPLFADELTAPPNAPETVLRLLERGAAAAELYSIVLVPGFPPGSATLLVGAGKRSDLDPRRWSRIVAAAVRTITRRGYGQAVLTDSSVLAPFEWGLASAAGAGLGTYDVGLGKSDRSNPLELTRLILTTTADVEHVRRGASQGTVLSDAIRLARDLVNTPANLLSPTTLAERTHVLADEHGLMFEALDEDRMRALEMGSLLAVASGSDEPARLITLRYGSDAAPIRLALVGKGITFDSGGLSLKTADGMETMKGDMGGGAAVIAAMTAIARFRPTGISVKGYVGATENMPSGHAMRPGDVVTASNGKTIEILNTDAEGRLVLADLLAYAEKQGSTHIVDVATLTGGAVVALGHDCTLAAGRPQEWVREVVELARAGLEMSWAMPILPEFRQAMDSEVADIKNVGGRAASALTASAFLSEFVSDVRWAHLDIAGTSWESNKVPYAPRGGTGAGVGSLIAVALALAGSGRR